MGDGSADEISAAFECIVANVVEEFADSSQPGVVRIQTVEGKGSVAVTSTDKGRGVDDKTRKTKTMAFISSKKDHRSLGLNAALYIA